MTRKVLGRGLSALLGEQSSIKSNEELLELDLDLIEPNSEQPRTRFAEEYLEELAQSIRSNGVVQPIVVRSKDGRYQIVAGERRWRAAQRAGLHKIPAIVRNISDDKLLEIALIENIQRQELNSIEEARAYKKLIDTVGLTQEMVAERVGKNRTVITTYLRLLRLPNDIQGLVEEEKITAGHARALLMTDDDNVRRQIARHIIDFSLSVRETEKAIKRATKGGGSVNVDKKELKQKQDVNHKAAETKLRRMFGTQVRIIPDGKGTGGKIEFEYYSESELDRIYQILVANS